MKKLYSLLLAGLMGVGAANAQTNPDRVVIYQRGAQPMSILAERVDSITFFQMEGRVAADVTISEVTLDSIKVTITPTEKCYCYKLMNVPAAYASRLTDDAAMANFVDANGGQQYYEGFTNGVLKDSSLEPDTKYVLVTLAYDNHGTPCSVCRVPFQMPQRPLAGNPKVTAEIAEVLARDFSIDFYPNEDVAGFAVTAGETGIIQAQYEQFAPMFGFKNFGQMIEMWGFKGKNEPVGFSWNRMEPATEYEIFVQAWDSNHTYAPCDTLKLTTKALGGEGVAEVMVTLGKYELAKWQNPNNPQADTLLASQTVTYSPNDQTARYRMWVGLDSIFNQDPEGIKKDLAQDPPMPMSGWYQYGGQDLTTDYQINPNTKFVILTAPRNSVGTWSEVKVDRFTTPAEVGGAKAAPAFFKQEVIQSRELKDNRIILEAGKMPNLYPVNQPRVLTITRK